MSLDVHLNRRNKIECECGRTHYYESEQVYWANITHNLTAMADAAGIYKELWRPDEIGIEVARQLIKPLSTGLDRLKADPEKYEAFNASNGWGLYKDFVLFVEKYLAACIETPDAAVSVWMALTTHR